MPFLTFLRFRSNCSALSSDCSACSAMAALLTFSVAPSGIAHILPRRRAEGRQRFLRGARIAHQRVDERLKAIILRFEGM